MTLTEKDLGAPNIIVPCAGQVTSEEASTISSNQWEREIQVNLNGAFYLAQAGALGLLKRKSQSSIVFIGSFAGLSPQVQHIAYSVSKAGVHALTKAMALEFSPYGMSVLPDFRQYRE